MRHVLIWVAVLVAIAVPVIAATMSPLLAWRQPIYIMAGFAGIAALCILLVQPLLAAGLLPGLSLARSRKTHQILGGALVFAVILHVGGLWIFSPPDVINALTLTSPTPFSVWGVAAMWAVFATALIVALRRRLRARVMTWRKLHTGLALIIVTGTIVHALLIEGAMETVTKILLCAAVSAITGMVIYRSRIWSKRSRRNVSS